MMTTSEREEWLELRKTGIGGSEVASLLSHILDVKYGCRHRLWLEKSGVPADHEFIDSAPVKLGRLFEAPLCDIYAANTGRRVEEIPRQVHPDHPELGVSIDRLIHAPEKKGPGVLEAKNMLGRNFSIAKREGLILDYMLQAQHGILVTSAALNLDIQWASFVVGRSDDPALIAFAIEWHMKMNPKVDLNPPYMIHFDVERNDDICNAILREGPAFWKTLGDKEQAPPKLEPDDYRCGRCLWRDGCQGSSLLPSASDGIPIAEDLTPLAAEYIERSKIADEANEAVAETLELVKIFLNDRQAVQVPIGGKLRPIYWRTEQGSVLYKQAVDGMSVQYETMKKRLVELGQPDAELIPPPASYLKRGANKRPLRMQYVLPTVKKEE